MNNVGATLLMLCIAPSTAAAQHVTLGVSAASVTHNEVISTNRVDGLGGAVVGTLVFDRFALEGFGYLASLASSGDPTVADFTVREFQMHARYQLTPLVGLEVSYLRRTIDPEFAAQDVGAFSAGARLQSDLTSIAAIYMRGAFSPITDFNGGGSSSLSYQIGFGFSIGPVSSRWRVTADYDFQRFGRNVRGSDVPIQLEAARVGIAYTIF